MIINKLIMSLLVLCTLYFSLIHYVHSAPQVKEYHVKATFIHNFTDFIRWPKKTFNTKQEPFQFCVIGDNPFGETLNILVQKYNERTTNDNPHIVSYLHRSDNISHCHLLYFSDSEESYFYQMLNKIRGKPILTISSIKGFAISGGMIQFYMRNSRVRFLIDPQTMRESKLKADANLLRVADIAGK